MDTTARFIDQRLEDSPYTFISKQGDEVILQYGDRDTFERWRLWTLPNITQSTFRTKVNGRWYRFAGTVPKNRAAVAMGRRGGKVKSEAKTIAARANGKRGGRPRKQENT